MTEQELYLIEYYPYQWLRIYNITNIHDTDNTEGLTTPCAIDAYNTFLWACRRNYLEFTTDQAIYYNNATWMAVYANDIKAAIEKLFKNVGGY